MKVIFKMMLAALCLLSACSPGAGEGGRLNLKQVLTMNPDADYVELENGEVYTHGADWVNEKNLTKGKQIAEIEKGMASDLPVGTILYVSKEIPAILLAEYDGKTKRYQLAMGE
ncbi:hypothetical protein GLV98_01930 [Halobacillus litoralis]|uniref:DUF3221 domain-containing protein n=1 Tax=Halobacillus litoralis TaxID=45668 RepID=A0A845E1R5_9BACI|nr:hypothetical protein [Halobacillus litoralis]MYL48219.1 hypothetical protein [Halobacillus litoralis]